MYKYLYNLYSEGGFCFNHVYTVVVLTTINERDKGENVRIVSALC